MSQPTWHRAHYKLAATHFLDLLEIPGELVAIQYDPVTGYIGIVTSDPSAPATLVGGYIEPQRFRVVRTVADGMTIAEDRGWQ